ncbi:MAG: toxic anion resistance protein [Pseudomonadota bacterium]
MTENTATTTTTVTTDTALQPAPAQLPAMQVQEVNHIVAVRPDFVDDAADEKLKQQANTIIDAILSNPTDANITVQIYSLGSEFMNANTESVSLMETKIGAVMKEIVVGSPVNKSLTQIKTELDLINPSVVSQTEVSLPSKAFFGMLTRMVSRLPKGEEILLLINERKDTVSTTINSLKRHLWTERDKALFNATELSNISNQLFETQQALQESVYIGQIIWARLNQAKEAEIDPLKQQALSNLVNDLAIQVVDIQTVDTLNVQSRMSAETLINNSRKIQQGVARVTNVLLPAVATNLMVKAAAAQQAQLVGSMNDITRAAEQTILDTAKQTRQATTAMEKMQSEGMINPDVLQSVADEAIAMINELEEIRAETELKARETSKALGNVASVMRRYADPMTKARQAIEKQA